MKDLIELFTTRLIHDLLNPIGAMQLALDNFESRGSVDNTCDQSSINILNNSVQNIISILDLVRKAYGYKMINLDNRQLVKLSEILFDKQINIKNEIDTKWIGDLLRLLVWLKYKILKDSQITIESTNQKLVVEVENIFLIESEYDMINNFNMRQEKTLDAYLIYLYMFLDKLDDNCSVKLIKEDKKHSLILELKS